MNNNGGENTNEGENLRYDVRLVMVIRVGSERVCEVE